MVSGVIGACECVYVSVFGVFVFMWCVVCSCGVFMWCVRVVCVCGGVWCVCVEVFMLCVHHPTECAGPICTKVSGCSVILH